MIQFFCLTYRQNNKMDALNIFMKKLNTHE